MGYTHIDTETYGTTRLYGARFERDEPFITQMANYAALEEALSLYS
jgi:hypothetical protein